MDLYGASDRLLYFCSRDLEVMEEAVDLLNLAQDTEIGCLIRTVASAAASELRVSYQDAAL